MKKAFIPIFLFIILTFNFTAYFFLSDRPTLSSSLWAFLILLSVTLILDIGLYFCKRHSSLRKVYLFTISLILTLTLFTNLTLSYHFKEFLTYEMLFYLKSDITGLINIAQSYLFNAQGLLLFFLILSGLYFSLIKARALQYKNKLFAQILIPSLLIFTFYATNKLTWIPSYSSTELISATIVSLKRGITQFKANNFLHRSVHKIPTKESYRSPYNILVIYHESWGLQATELYQSDQKSMPQLTDFYNQNRQTFLKFERAYTNSTATDLSVPAILTGLNPTNELHKFQDIPFIWNWAQAFNFETYLISSQRFEWGRFDQYFLASPPDHVVTAETSGHKVIHDIGIDDHLSADTLIESLKSHTKEKPFFAIFNTNAMHMPFQQKSQI